MPEPLQMPATPDLLAVDQGLGVGALGEGVGGHDGGGGLGPAILVQGGLDLWQAVNDLGVVQQDADDAGGGDHHVALAAVGQRLGDGRGVAPDSVGARLSGEGIGAACIDHEGANIGAQGGRGQMFLAPVHGARIRPHGG
jgi:hypothetical protein